MVETESWTKTNSEQLDQVAQELSYAQTEPKLVREHSGNIFPVWPEDFAVGQNLKISEFRVSAAGFRRTDISSKIWLIERLNKQ